jgi:hypothetical protein
MFEKNKLWLGLGVAIVTGTSLGAAGAADPETSRPVTAKSTAANASIGAVPLRVTQHTPREAGERGKAGEAGERGKAAKAGEGGEGGEGGERGAAGNLTRSASAYLTQLGLIRGHLNVGTELYRIGDQKAAVTHMKHPEDELYAALKPALAKRGAPGFDKELSVLADKVEKNAGKDEVEAAYKKLLAAIKKAENAVPKPSPHQIGEVIHNLMRAAASEYREAVADGHVVEAHEYQDALGFVRVAEDWMKVLEERGGDPSVVGEIRKQIDLIKPAWSGVVPPKSVTVDPSQIHGAAARIEIATLSLKRQ